MDSLNQPSRSIIIDKISSLPENSKERAFWEKVLLSLDNSSENSGLSLGDMTVESTRAVAKIRSVTESVQKNIQTVTGSVASGIKSTEKQTSEFVSKINLPKEFYEITKPISFAVGSTVNTATAIVKDPLGAPFILANSLTSVIDKINPNFANQLDSAFKTANIDNLQHLPSKIMGSLRQLSTAADALLSVPFELLSDMYNGLLEIMEAIADLIDGIASAVLQLIQKIAFQILDSVIPLTEIMSFLTAINELASTVGNVAQIAGGFQMVTDITNQVTSYSNSFSSALSNPLQLALSYVPEAQQGFGILNDFTGALRDPEKALQQFLPPEINQQLGNISQLPGLGFIGNRGYSVGNILDTLSQGVFSVAAKQFPNQTPILGPLFNQKTEPTENAFAQEQYEDGYVSGKHRQDQQVSLTAPITQFTTPAPKIFSEKSAYGITEDQKGNMTSFNSSFTLTPEGQTIKAYGFTETIKTK